MTRRAVDTKRRILLESQIDRLKKHQYKSKGQSILDPYMNVFWKWLVEQVPMWVAPNLLTWVGLMVNVITTALVVFYNPSMEEGVQVPSWVYVLCALGIFFYQSLDNIDGKQARRTGSATPLGELFDHGCDSVSTSVVVVGVLTALQVGSSLLGFLTAAQAICLFYFAHWECYVKGRVHFNTVDVTEAQWTIIMVHLLTAIFGEGIWGAEVFGFPARQFVLVPTLAVAAFTMASYYNSIWEGGSGPANTSAAATGILSPMTALVAWCLGVWHMHSLEAASDLPAIFILGAGCASAKITCQLIVAHMTKSPVPQFDISHAVPLLSYISAGGTFFMDGHTFLLAACIFWFIDLWIYGIQICLDISQSFGIKVFSITPKPQPDDADAH
ncbi:hypothetical protein PTSG_09909 [Salpingoeca rosetta]|uniref:Choline/ethanolaminephosphotransferase 1 n=1 Tax=Salpingoeca rosetta (strain ATCC 50818 / BSB-021) TaxID=946362 RepID=F2UNH4_SALR5|nr:uncharacterized protein PTSG_09909 [Salpingoeca rosetta]EGD79179.1 hypothetical protein PTSG_09909 [Salpingoeca rosetta]|eukprot:XP_004989264.1 hypothetical protein PTSG_09909 [Salpingoeca rosetta]